MANSLHGTVIRATANFFFVQSGSQVYRSQPRGRIKKEGMSILVGDRVTFQLLDDHVDSGVITAVAPRRNRLERPAVANVDQAILVHALRRPDLDYMLLDRFLLFVHSLAAQLDILLCFNKADLADLRQVEEVRRLYEPLGYRIVVTSARTGLGIDHMRSTLVGRTSVLSGPSGAGKSHLLAAIQPGLKLRYDPISERIGRGRHITRLVSLYTVRTPEGTGYVVDTPGFSLLELSHLLPWEAGQFYPEFGPWLDECRYPRCLHWQEPVCAVKARVDKRGSRYLNYLRFVQELQEQYRNAVFTRREEGLVKERDAESGRKLRLLKLGLAERDPSRRRIRQTLADYHLDREELAEE